MFQVAKERHKTTSLAPATSGATIRYNSADSLNSGASVPAFCLPNQAIYTEFLGPNPHMCKLLTVQPCPVCIPRGP